MRTGTDAVYARSAADDEAGTACRDQVRQALERVEEPARAAVYADPGASGLDANRPALCRLLADVRRGGLRRVVVRDLARLARSAPLLETILEELRATDVELVTIGEGNRHA
ncbi:MAG: recombinase family protein [Planctomycetes bacterium]|nr:recombinase family protein [Planctomycetota bacterium]